MTSTDTPDDALRWIKSSYSGGSSTECVEAAADPSQAVRVRDSKRPCDGTLRVGARGWDVFLAAVHGI